MEKRFYNNDVKIELREGEDGKRTIEFYAAKFNKWSRNFGKYFREKIAPGFFDDVLESEDTVALKNHNTDLVFGRNKHTLVISVDEVGLRCKCDLPNTTVGNDLAEDIKLGNIRACSFAFGINEDKWEKSEIREVEFDRTLVRALELPDVSLVTNPAYPDTSVTFAKREYEAYCSEHRKDEQKDADTERSRSAAANQLHLTKTKLRLKKHSI